MSWVQVSKFPFCSLKPSQCDESILLCMLGMVQQRGSLSRSFQKTDVYGSSQCIVLCETEDPVYKMFQDLFLFEISPLFLFFQPYCTRLTVVNTETLSFVMRTVQLCLSDKRQRIMGGVTRTFLKTYQGKYLKRWMSICWSQNLCHQFLCRV